MGQSLMRFMPRPADFLTSLGVFGCLLASPASAAVTILAPGTLTQGFPDVTVSMVSVSYDATTDTLHAGIAPGGLLTIDQDGVLPSPDQIVFNSTFNLFTTIDSSGLPASGTLLISGNYDSPGGAAFSLQSSALTGFGYDPSTGVFSFLFDNATSTVPDFGSQIGINLAGNFPFSNPVGFGSDFSNAGPLGGLGNADVFGTALEPSSVLVPEPSSLIAWSIVSAVAGLAGWRRTRRRREEVCN